jgi:hypothetical protein
MDDRCYCPCLHRHSEDLGRECTDDYCGYCGEEIP